jgi:hypothetical protein
VPDGLQGSDAQMTGQDTVDVLNRLVGGLDGLQRVTGRRA